MTVEQLAAALPSGPAYTVVLLCHVAAAVVGMVTMVAGAAFSLRLLAAGDGPVPPAVRSYFSPGTNWVGRVLYLVPVFGVALLAMSGGAYRAGSDWVLAGIGLWVVAIGLAELALWPAEQRVRRTLAATSTVVAAGPTGAPPITADPAGALPVTAAPVHGAPRAASLVPPAARRAARRMCLASLSVLVLLLAATVVMLAKP